MTTWNILEDQEVIEAKDLGIKGIILFRKLRIR